MATALAELQTRLRQRLARGAGSETYRVPGYWVDPQGSPEVRVVVPEVFFLERIASIRSQPAQARVAHGGAAGGWSSNAIAYNLFIRAAAAWDHDGDGQVTAGPNSTGWRETGTFLKAITLLPFIRSLGCNTIHLLPIAEIGQDGHKGELGSPFAIRDPYVLEPTLAEPALFAGPAAVDGPGSDIELQFAAFMEAAHHLGLRVIAEFVFRTAALDAVWVEAHPEWFYWIRADLRDWAADDREAGESVFGPPVFSVDELAAISAQVEQGHLADLLPPPADYRDFFLPPPRPEDVHFMDGRWVGVVEDPDGGERITARIPGAFSDWPPDSTQPPWSDVTYLRLYDHPDFNYMAYNTLRMYDTRLAQPEHAVSELWDRIVEVIPHYQQAFGIDGVLIDMGHALPAPLKQRIVARAREVDPGFALWAEDFTLGASSREEGYNLVVGPYFQEVREPDRFCQWLRELGTSGVPVPFLATPETHDSPRAAAWPGCLAYSTYSAAVGAFLPAVPYIHGGSELGEIRPVNTGIGFTPDELALLPASRLPLFSAVTYGWARHVNAVPALRRMLAVRRRFAELVTDADPAGMHVTDAGNVQVISLLRGRPGGPLLGILANGDAQRPQAASVVLPAHLTQIENLLTGSTYALAPGGLLSVVLEPGEVLVYELPA